ncbi:MAG TPA: hypothetical protein VJH89_03685 [Patescibacteria group bacterium]|nr:hypothetical protein [Patescibacteria group bacterium]
MSHKTLIIVFLALFSFSTFFLFWQNAREMDPERNKDWWTLAFATPLEANDFSFILENHSNNTRFDYTILANKKVLLTESFIVTRGDSITITPPLAAHPDTRITIMVTDGQDTKEIYR